MSETAPTLPGMDGAGTSPNMMQRAAAEYIQALRDRDLIKGHHVLTVQLVLDLAAAVGKASAKGQAAAMAMASKELREAMELLPVPVSNDDPFTAFLNELKEESK